MPVNATIQVEGLKELHTELLNLQRSAQRGFQRKAMRAAVRPVVNTARRLAPRRTGHGAKSIRGRVIVKGTAAEGIVGFSKKRFYMRFHETGTRKMRPRPFLRPALDSQKGAAMDAYRTTMAGLIEEAIKKVVEGDGEEDVN